MPWWLWVVGGLLLLAIEAAAPGGFFAVFFGLAAILVGMLEALGGVPGWAQWLLFSVLSVAGLFVFRRPLLVRFTARHGRRVDQLEGEAAVVLEEIRPGGVGRAELRGSVWSARTHGETTLEAGRRCRVEWVEGLTLWVRAE